MINNLKTIIQDLKNKLMAIVGEFLQNGVKLDQARKLANTLNASDKEIIIKRIDFLKQRQEILFNESQIYTKKMDEIQSELEKYKSLTSLTNLGWRSLEVIKNLIGKAKFIIKGGNRLINQMDCQNRDVNNLIDSISKGTKTGFKFQLPKLSDITTPIATTAKYVGIGLGAVALIYVLQFIPKPRH